MNDVELRLALLNKADTLMTAEWENKVKVEEALAKFENRPPVAIRPPTLHRVMTLAEKFYGWVVAPPKNPRNPLAPAVVRLGAQTSTENPEEKPMDIDADLEDLFGTSNEAEGEDSEEESEAAADSEEEQEDADSSEE